MRRAAALALMLSLAAACSQSAQAPPPEVPSGELIFTVGPDGGHRVYQSRDGALVADLGSGALAYQLSGGGDVAEAYLVGDEPAGIRRVKPGRPFSVAKVAAGPPAGSAAPEAVMVPAPALSSFVGEPAVLVVRAGDGSLEGYQAGRPLWQDPPGTASRLLAEGNLAFVESGGSWMQVKPETGVLSEPAPPGCEPAGDVDGRAVLACSGTLRLAGKDIGGRTGSGEPFAFHPVRSSDLLLYWPSSGGLCRVGVTASCRGVALSKSRPAFTPDGRLLLLAVGGQIVEQETVGGPIRWLKAGETYQALASSRDGSYLYAAGGDHLDVWSLGTTPARTRRYRANAADIDLVAGG